MTVLKSVLRPVLNDILRPIIFSDVVTRFFTTLVASGSMHYTIPTVTLPGDFEISIEFMTTAAGNQVLLGDDFATAYFFNFDDTRFTVWFAGSNVNYLFGAQNPKDGKLHVARYKLTGTSLEMFLDGISLGSNTITPFVGANDFTIATANGVFFTGIIANVSITDAGTPIRFYALDENFATTTVAVDTISGQNGTAVNISESDLFTLQAGGNYLGVELSFIDDPIDTVVIGGPSISDYPVGPVLTGNVYRIGSDITNYLGSGTIGIRNEFGTINGTGVRLRSDDGRVQIDYLSTGTGDQSFFSRDTNQATFSNTTLKQLLEKA